MTKRTNQHGQPLNESLPKEFRLERSRIMYIEDKSQGLEGEGRIGRVYFSHTRITPARPKTHYRRIEIKINITDLDKMIESSGEVEVWILGS